MAQARKRAPVTPGRRAPGSGGTLRGQLIEQIELAPRLRDWLERAGLADASVEAVDALEFEIVNAYGQGKSKSKSFTTVLRVKLPDRDLVARGVDTAVNWASGEGEVSRGLLRSFDQAAVRLVGLLTQACRPDGDDRQGLRMRVPSTDRLLFTVALAVPDSRH